MVLNDVLTLQQDSANIDSLVVLSQSSDVTVFTPAGSPRVLDQPVVVSVRASAPADQQHTVVESSSAALVGVDTRVILEPMSSADSDGHWVVHGGDLELDGVLSVQHSPGVHGGEVGSNGSASAVSGGVLVVALKRDAIGDDVVESVPHFSSSATGVSGSVAIDQILLGVSVQSAGVQELSSFDGGDGGESPTRSASLLVLDWGDGALVLPVEAGWWVLVQVLELGGLWSSWVGHSSVSEELGFLLFLGHVGELVQSELVRQVLGVDALDLLEVLVENLEPIILLAWGGVESAVLEFPGGEGLLDLEWNGGVNGAVVHGGEDADGQDRGTADEND